MKSLIKMLLFELYLRLFDTEINRILNRFQLFGYYDFKAITVHT